MRLILFTITVAILAIAHAIYPADHFTFSKELTTDNFDAHVQSEIDAGRTLFVRWIASEG